MTLDVTLSVSEFVAVCNQTLEYAYPSVVITGELANFRVSKNRWVYFDLKDEQASVRFFGTVYQLPGPLQDGMLVAVKGTPRLHPQYGFSVTVQTIRPTGEGSIKKAAALLEAKLKAEGLFDPARKRSLPYPPTTIGLITSAESAAFKDFMKIINARWKGLDITLVDVQVQGEAAPAQLVAAIEFCNQASVPLDVLVITRGGGSAEDLQAFSTEQVTRAVASSRIPTLVAIGHEVDSSLAELAADRRASTPSNAAELLVPDRVAVLAAVAQSQRQLTHSIDRLLTHALTKHHAYQQQLHSAATQQLQQAADRLKLRAQVLAAFDPRAALQRGYALVRANGQLVRAGRLLQLGQTISTEFGDALVASTVTVITPKEKS